MSKKGIDIATWDKLSPSKKINYLKNAVEGDNGGNGLRSDVNALHDKFREVEIELKGISHSMINIKWLMRITVFMLSMGGLNEAVNLKEFVMKLFF